VPAEFRTQVPRLRQGDAADAPRDLPATSTVAARFRIFREWEFFVLATVVAAIYGARLTTLPIRGEETRRAEVATEMLRTGDWVVPREQGAPFLSRPPLGSYPIALLEMLWGTGSLLAVRLPSIAATWLMTLIVYGYSRRFLEPLGALAAGFAFATSGMVLQLGRLAETEAQFTLLVGGSLLLWHWGYSSRWRQPWPWVIGYLFAALGALTKGPQAPLYFVGSVVLYLAWRRDWRQLLSWGHAAGIAVFIGVVSAWQIPFWLATDWPSVKAIWFSDVGLRFDDANWARAVLHLLFFPVGVLICVLPWSPLLSAYLFPSFRERIGAARPWVTFLGATLIVAFPTCWLVPGAKERYFMPLFPCMAPLIGLVIQRALAADASRAMRIGWVLYLGGASAAILSGGLAVAGASWIDGLQAPELSQPGWFAAAYLALALVVFATLLRRGAIGSPARAYCLVLGLAAFVGITHVSVVVNGMTRVSEDAAPAIAALKRKLPPHVRLVSFGYVETLFSYHFDEPIELRHWPPTEQDLADGHDYFCFSWDQDYIPPFPFAWRIIDEIPCCRWQNNEYHKRVIVGQRLANVGPGELRIGDNPVIRNR
jgi:4-amino-4-deoxy-L-arabinose transferase-like glycosyltransferase